MKKEMIFILIFLLLPLAKADNVKNLESSYQGIIGVFEHDPEFFLLSYDLKQEIYEKSNSGHFKFYEDFEVYPLGKLDTTIWVPQYDPITHIIESNSKELELNSFTEFRGDRDNHVQLNITNFTKIYDNLKITFDFKALECNSTWKMTQGVTPQASSVYAYYSNEDNFISIEFKVKANNTFCGDGEAQISAFKRVNHISTSLIPFTTYNFSMNKTYRPILEINNTNNKTTIYIQIDNRSIVSSEFDFSNNGNILIENGGTKTIFDNVYILSKDIVCSPVWKENIQDCINKKQVHSYEDINNCNTNITPSNLTLGCNNYNSRNESNENKFTFKYLSDYISSNKITQNKEKVNVHIKSIFGNTFTKKIHASSFKIISVFLFAGMFIFCVMAWMNIRKTRL